MVMMFAQLLETIKMLLSVAWTVVVCANKSPMEMGGGLSP